MDLLTEVHKYKYSHYLRGHWDPSNSEKTLTQNLKAFLTCPGSGCVGSMALGRLGLED